MRNINIDLIKGLLIILVITGHILKGSLSDSIVRNTIYSFHMPLFIGISGYLFNINKIKSYNLITIIKKYLFRVIVPWAIAVFVYIIIREKPQDLLKFINSIGKSFLFPFYHLWYVPGFLAYVVLTWLMNKIKLSERSCVIIALFISITFKILASYPQIYEDFENIKKFIKFINHTFRLYFYIFFIIGVYFREKIWKNINIYEIITLCILFIISFYLFYYPNKIFSLFHFYVFNIFLLQIIIRLVQLKRLPEVKWVESLGINSLGIYLWHMVPILYCKYLIKKENVEIYYLFCSVSVILLIKIMSLLSKNKIINKLLFGL